MPAKSTHTRTNAVKNGARSNRRKAQKRMAQAVDPIVGLLLDPCNGDTSTPFYNGEGGYSQRFVKTFTVTTGATDTALTTAFFPGANLWSAGTATNDTTNFTNQFSKASSPGATFLAANASKIRCKAACVEMWSNQAPLNITGTMGFGIVPATSYQSGSAQNAAQLGSTVQNQVKLTADIIECLWFPGNLDSTYVIGTAAATDMPNDSEDRNAIVFVGTGLPVSTSYTFRVTWVAEWTPRVGLEVSVPLAGNGNTQHVSNVVNALNTKHSGWYAKLKSHGQQFAKIAMPVIKKELGNLAMNYGPKLLAGASAMLL